MIAPATIAGRVPNKNVPWYQTDDMHYKVAYTAASDTFDIEFDDDTTTSPPIPKPSPTAQAGPSAKPRPAPARPEPEPGPRC